MSSREQRFGRNDGIDCRAHDYSLVLIVLVLLLGHERLDEPPELGRVLGLDLAPLVDEGAVPLQELDPLLSVRRDVVVLVLEK